MSILDGNQVNRAVRVLKSGGIVAYPTETLYGLGADITNKQAVNEVFLLKKREYSKPLSIAVSGFEQIYKLAEVSDWQINILKKYLPGPYTFLLKNKRVILDIVVSSSDLIGFRYPDHDLALKIISKLGRPITSTSANLSGNDPTGDYKSIDVCPDYVAKGECKYKQGSTIIDLVNRKILRRGAGFDNVKDIFVD